MKSKMDCTAITVSGGIRCLRDIGHAGLHLGYFGIDVNGKHLFMEFTDREVELNIFSVGDIDILPISDESKAWLKDE